MGQLWISRGQHIFQDLCSLCARLSVFSIENDRIGSHAVALRMLFLSTCMWLFCSGLLCDCNYKMNWSVILMIWWYISLQVQDVFNIISSFYVICLKAMKRCFFTSDLTIYLIITGGYIPGTFCTAFILLMHSLHFLTFHHSLGCSAYIALWLCWNVHISRLCSMMHSAWDVRVMNLHKMRFVHHAWLQASGNSTLVTRSTYQMCSRMVATWWNFWSLWGICSTPPAHIGSALWTHYANNNISSGLRSLSATVFTPLIRTL